MPVARTSFSVDRRVIRAGTHVAPDDPVLDGREHLFTSDGVEQATAAPGEKRNVSRTCAGTTASGDPCSNKAGEDGYCRHHGDD